MSLDTEEEEVDPHVSVAEEIIKQIYFGDGSWMDEEFEIVTLFMQKMFDEHPNWNENDLREILLAVSKTLPPEEWSEREQIPERGKPIYLRGSPPDSIKNYGDSSAREA